MFAYIAIKYMQAKLNKQGKSKEREKWVTTNFKADFLQYDILISKVNFQGIPSIEIEKIEIQSTEIGETEIWNHQGN